MKAIIQTYMTKAKELIETLWNVNLYEDTSISFLMSELIETLWNVNTHRE